MQSSPIVFDEQRKAAKQLRALKGDAGNADFLARRIIEDFSHRISAINREFDRTCDLFSFFDVVCETLADRSNVGEITRYELPAVAEKLGSPSGSAVKSLNLFTKSEHAGGHDKRLWPVEADLIVSILGFPTGAEIQELMHRVYSSLKNDGLLLMALPANGTLHELRECLTQAELELCDGAANRVDPFIDTMRAGNILQNAGFKLPVIDREELVIRYDDIYALIRDLRAMGMTSAYRHNARTPFVRNLFERAGRLYKERFSDEDGRIRASFNYLNLTAWAPHDSQQQPLKPGSATKPLSEGLKIKK